MTMVASYRMVDRDLIDRLLQLDDDDLTEELNEIGNTLRHPVLDIDATWDGLHFLLTGKSVAVPLKNSPLSEAIIGTHHFNDSDRNDFITYTLHEELHPITEALLGVEKEALWERFDPVRFSCSKIYPDIWTTRSKEELFSLLYETGWERLTAFYRQALQDEKCVIICIR